MRRHILESNATTGTIRGRRDRLREIMLVVQRRCHRGKSLIEVTQNTSDQNLRRAMKSPRNLANEDLAVSAPERII